jgi:hypothetical protein
LAEALQRCNFATAAVVQLYNGYELVTTVPSYLCERIVQQRINNVTRVPRPSPLATRRDDTFPTVFASKIQKIVVLYKIRIVVSEFIDLLEQKSR